MLLYVAAKFNSLKEAVRALYKLQTADTENAYISPEIMFAHIKGRVEETIFSELCIDVLSACDKLVILGEITDEISSEIDFARLVGMEVEKVENHFSI